MFTFLFICSLLIPLSMFILGKRWSKNPPKKINGFSGYRTTMSTLFFASTFWRKMQNIFGECCISKLEKVARPRLAAILPAT